MSKAIFFAKAKIEETKISGFPDIGIEVEQEDENYKGFLWAKRVEQTEIEGLRKLTVAVNWLEGHNQQEVTKSEE